MGTYTVTNSNTVKSLAKKHAEIQGNIQKAEANLLTMKNTLHAVEVSIHLFDPDYKTSNIALKRTNKKTQGLSHGEIPKIVGDYIRGSQSEFNAGDVVGYIHQERFNSSPDTDMTNIKKNVFNALKRLCDQGIICETGRSGKGGALVWRLSD